MTSFEWLSRHHGLTRYAWQQLRRIEHRLHRIDEEMCNGTIQRDDNGGNYRHYVSDQWGSPTVPGRKLKTTPEDLGAEAARIAKRFNLAAYHQTDPRGCALYLVDPAELGDRDVDRCYSSIGTAVC
jgi:hypothetical protein